MADRRDYYEILGVSVTCSDDELKSAYRRLAIKYHPDRNPNDEKAEDAFKECAEAYEVLSDPEKRQIYDQYGHAGLNGQGYRGFSGFEDIFSQFSDVFQDLFGFSGRGRGMAGADLRYDLEIDFETAVFGDEVELEIPRRVTCIHCEGSGAKPGTTPSPCPTCRGRGQVYRSQGFLRVATTCPTCHGEGRIVNDPCPECGGQGRVEQDSKVRVKFPAGVDNGTRLRLRGEGEGGMHGGPPGDLYVILHVKPHELFERNGNELIYRLHLDMVQAALGLEVEVPTLNKSKKLKIPQGVESGHIFKLRGEGVPHVRGFGRGDLLVQVNVHTPSNLTARQKELLAEFVQIEEEKNAGKEKGRPGRMKGGKKGRGR